MRKLLYTFMISALYALSTSFAWAECPNCIDTLRVTVADLKSATIVSSNGQLFVDIDKAWQPLNAVGVTEDGYCFLKTGNKRKKRYFSAENSSSDSELHCVLKCPKCLRLQSCLLVLQNGGECAQCGSNLKPYYRK